MKKADLIKLGYKLKVRSVNGSRLWSIESDVQKDLCSSFVSASDAWELSLKEYNHRIWGRDE